MTAKIIHLSEYLEKYHHDILKATVHALGMDTENPEHMDKVNDMMVAAASKKFRNMIELETQLIDALKKHDNQAVKQLLDIQEFDEHTFDGVDIAENYDFHCSVINPIARDNIMDWLEENKLDYLIDNEGRFAVKCPTRRIEYKVGRAFEHMMNKWDPGPTKKPVDPDPKRMGLGDIKRPSLIDGVQEEINEIAAHQPTYSPGTGKGVETGLGPSMFPADKKEKTRHFSDQELAKMTKESKRKKTVKQRERQAKEKLAKLKPIGSGGAERIMKDFGQHGTDPKRMDQEQKQKLKKQARKKVDIRDINESAKLDEQVMGMIGMISMPTIGRIQELAGLTDDSKIKIAVDPQQHAPSCKEHVALDLAKTKLHDLFNVYETLPLDEKEEFRKQLINHLMKED